ncbi:TIGR00270 family protein [Candidatus Woesearchaeota archaeon]|nr:TIGR00270 family protein [Candidatus Woesearchaeota archaeon]
MLCELCGKQGELFKAKVESTELTVCKNCSKYRKVLGHADSLSTKNSQKSKQVLQVSQQPAINEPEEFILSNYSELIRKKREQLKLNQEDFAKLLNEKLSILHKIETNSFEMSIEQAKKFEKILHLKLVELFKEPDMKILHEKKEGFTLGDFIKVKKRN